MSRVNPTRMEMQRQKARLKTASRGHKLLKDKSDAMIRTLISVARENLRLRREVEDEVSAALGLFVRARAVMTTQEVEGAILGTQVPVSFNPLTTNIMGLVAPKFEFEQEISTGASHSTIRTNNNFDKAVEQMKGSMEKLIKLAEVEKTCDMLSVEIVKVRRRINALEHILMPQIRETIRFIRMKLTENERSQQVRVMKVKANLQAENAS